MRTITNLKQVQNSGLFDCIRFGVFVVILTDLFEIEKHPLHLHILVREQMYHWKESDDLTRTRLCNKELQIVVKRTEYPSHGSIPIAESHLQLTENIRLYFENSLSNTCTLAQLKRIQHQ